LIEWLLCQENKIVLIEDLAIQLVLFIPKKEAGTVGDFTILSFSQDKVIDGISGGALIVRNTLYNHKVWNKYFKNSFRKREK